jgi:excisionase family DNA binding protein
MDKTNANPLKLLKIKEASDLLGVHTATLRRWSNSGKIKTVRIGTRRGVGDRRYRLEDIQRLMHE